MLQKVINIFLLLILNFYLYGLTAIQNVHF